MGEKIMQKYDKIPSKGDKSNCTKPGPKEDLFRQVLLYLGVFPI
jgi:hypothetical protein